MTDSGIITQRVETLRQWMRSHGLTAYLFPSTDPHASEYVPDHWKVREWVSGFNGSAGTAVVSLTRAALWTDSRYWLAAEAQLAGTPFEVIRCGRNVATADELMAWIVRPESASDSPAAEAPVVVGLDAWTNMSESVAGFEAAAAAHGLGLRTDIEPTAALWSRRPELPTASLEIQPLELAGETAQSKLSRLRQAIRAAGADATVVTQLDDIAWTLNLRGADVHCTPVFVSYLLLLPDAATLFVNPAKLTPRVTQYLAGLGVRTAPYASLASTLASGCGLHGLRFLIDPAVTNRAICAFLSAAPDAVSVVEAPCPITSMKALKNEAEIAGFHNAMLKDGVAMVQFLRWLDDRHPSHTPSPAASPSLDERGLEDESLTERSVDAKLTALRAAQPGFRGLSFDTIAGYGAHAAIVHYEATPETDIPLEPHGFLLLDSGGQYQDGTTDITRTIALGPLTDDERRDYTLVLKGHIRLATAVFPEGTTGTQLDVLARYAMWQEHKNYGHGTGHGVGSYLGVHEGPHQFRMNYVPAPLKAGMTVTIEPGIYIAGSHGVRIENTMLITDSPSASGGEDSSWFCLEPLTLCPIDTRPILREMMLPDEIDYLNKYHARVREALLPLLDDEDDREWLVTHTASI